MTTLRFFTLALLLLAYVSIVATAQALPDLPVKPQPQFDMKAFCPPMGRLSKESDPDRNQMKNRVDEASKYHRVTVEDLKALASPQGKLNKRRSQWTTQQLAVVRKNEGIPIVLSGYFLPMTSFSGKVVGAIPEGPEECNCWRTELQFVDLRLWLVNNPNDSEKDAVVAQMTPRVRVKHRQWTIDALTYIAKNRFPVRVYGWLLFEEDEQNQVGVTRGTLWEIHPIIQIEVNEHGLWKTL